MTLWFTADHHFGHANIIDFCRRPFRDRDEMDEAMVERWNATVGVQDEVWHLGDFAYRCGPNRLSTIFRSLNGRAIHLVRGNHDRGSTLSLPWTSIQHYAEIDAEGRMLVLFHYPIREWNRSRFGSISLHGYGHGMVVDAPASCNVGVDVWNFKPIKLQQILARVGNRSTSIS